jgi:hypothetical protein
LASNEARDPQGEASTPTTLDQRPPEAATSPDQGEFSLKKAAFEIAIVAVGVLLALAVDEARQAREQRQLAQEGVSAMRDELRTNRGRLARKLGLLHAAYVQLEADPSTAASLVAQRRNQQITLSDSAWVMTVETGALRLLSPEERTLYASVYTAQHTYYDILTQEMSHWAALAAFGDKDQSPAAVRERDKAVALWKAYANRVTLGVCISAARIEIVLDPSLSRDKLWAACQSYGVTRPPAVLYRDFGVTMPQAAHFLR